MLRPFVISMLALGVMAVVAGCPASDPGDDAMAPDTGLVVTEAGLALCSQPGAYCTPADPCGLNPRCGNNRLCVPVGLRDCDDGISCTTDRCVPGGCEHTVQDGYCLIDEVCHKKGVTVGCGRCAPEVSKTRWSPLNGVPCDDKNPCTKGDECNQGICVGQAYSCSDGLACTTDSCDGEGGCKQFLDAGYCLIEQSCYADGQFDVTGCKVCNVSIAKYVWQIRVNVCKIEGKCYGAGSKDPTGCYTCEPLHVPDAWTPLPGLCLIGQVCIPKGSLHPSGCALCDPNTSTGEWTPQSGASLTITAFSAGTEGYVTTAPVGSVGWQVSTARFTSQPASLYYGDLATKTYDSGSANKGTATSPTFQLPAGQKGYLSFFLYMDTEKTSNFDVLTVTVNGKELWSKTTDMVAADYKQWVQVTLDLSAFAGQSAQIVFAFDTKDDLNNQLEGVYIDDVTVLTGCGAI